MRKAIMAHTREKQRNRQKYAKSHGTEYEVCKTDYIEYEVIASTTDRLTMEELSQIKDSDKEFIAAQLEAAMAKRDSKMGKQINEDLNSPEAIALRVKLNPSLPAAEPEPRKLLTEPWPAGLTGVIGINPATGKYIQKIN